MHRKTQGWIIFQDSANMNKVKEPDTGPDFILGRVICATSTG